MSFRHIIPTTVGSFFWTEFEENPDTHFIPHSFLCFSQAANIVNSTHSSERSKSINTRKHVTVVAYRAWRGGKRRKVGGRQPWVDFRLSSPRALWEQSCTIQCTRGESIGPWERPELIDNETWACWKPLVPYQRNISCYFNCYACCGRCRGRTIINRKVHVF